MPRNTIKEGVQSSEEWLLFQRRTEAFIAEIIARGGYKRLYFLKHTNKVAKDQNITLVNFYKLLKRMADGIGLLLLTICPSLLGKALNV